MGFFLQIIWLLIPAGFANMSAVAAVRLFPRCNYPADLYKTFRKKRIFGEHKTLRGLIAGVIIGEVVYLVQLYILHIFPEFRNIAIIPVSSGLWWLGFIMGLGALCGDMVKSFFKRQVGILPGKYWIPFDQIDWIVGSLLLSAPFISLTLSYVFTACLFGFFLSIMVKFIGYRLKIDSKPI